MLLTARQCWFLSTRFTVACIKNQGDRDGEEDRRHRCGEGKTSARERKDWEEKIWFWSVLWHATSYNYYTAAQANLLLLGATMSNTKRNGWNGKPLFRTTPHSPYKFTSWWYPSKVVHLFHNCCNNWLLSIVPIHQNCLCICSSAGNVYIQFIFHLESF